MYLGVNDDVTEFPPEWNPLQLALAALGTLNYSFREISSSTIPWLW